MKKVIHSGIPMHIIAQQSTSEAEQEVKGESSVSKSEVEIVFAAHNAAVMLPIVVGSPVGNSVWESLVLLLGHHLTASVTRKRALLPAGYRSQ